MEARFALEDYFRRIGRRVYLACELPVYYPGEPVFAPVVFAVRDVELHPRNGWVVSVEGKGLDLALEVIVSGKRRKDNVRNVELYARLGIAEYFIFDRARLRLSGYRLPQPGAKAYKPILAQGGLYTSAVLGLDLRLDETKLRFYHGMAPVPEARELISTLQSMVDGVERRAEAAELRAQGAENRTQEAENRRQEVARALASSLEENDRLRRRLRELGQPDE